MPINRFFTEDTIQIDAEVTFGSEESKHMTKVLRLETGDTIEVIDGKGGLATARISSSTKNTAAAVILTCHEYIEAPGETLLCQALVRMSKLDLIIEKGTELGVTHFVLFPANGSEKGDVSKSQLERLHTILLSAIKQSGRLFLPKLTVVSSISEVTFPQNTFFGDLRKGEKELFWQIPTTEEVAFINGPESGFTEKEYAFFAKNNFRGITLSNAILRTETAAITAAALFGQRL